MHQNTPVVPFEEDDHDPNIWFLDHSFLEGMYRMMKKVNGACMHRQPGRTCANVAC